jgi:hypothetical protein
LVNLQYLVKKNSDEIFEAFVIDSLRHEKKLLETIKTEIQQRNGIELPIERRMLDSIESAFVVSGVTIDQVSNKAASKWKDLKFYDRVAEIGLSAAYLAMFGGPSHNVHGSWQDMLEYHLEHDESGFSPKLDWHRPRPQVLLTIARFQVETLHIYFPFVTGVERAFHVELDDLFLRIDLANRCHEDFLSKRQTNKGER